MSDYLESKIGASKRRLARGGLNAYERKILEQFVERTTREIERDDKENNSDVILGFDDGEPMREYTS